MSALAPASGSLAPGADTMVLFDWNGTVVTDADRAWDALNAALSRSGVPTVRRPEFSRVFRLPMQSMFLDLGVAAMDLGRAEDDWNCYVSAHRTVLRDGAAAALTTLHDAGAWLGVMSAASMSAVRFDLESLAVPDVFSAIEAPVADKATALRQLRLRRSRAFYAGDTAYDMESALAAGYMPVALRGGYAQEEALLEAGAVCVVDSLMEVADLVLTADDDSPSGERGPRPAAFNSRVGRA